MFVCYKLSRTNRKAIWIFCRQVFLFFFSFSFVCRSILPFFVIFFTRFLRVYFCAFHRPFRRWRDIFGFFHVISHMESFLFFVFSLLLSFTFPSTFYFLFPFFFYLFYFSFHMYISFYFHQNRKVCFISSVFISLFFCCRDIFCRRTEFEPSLSTVNIYKEKMHEEKKETKNQGKTKRWAGLNMRCKWIEK